MFIPILFVIVYVCVCVVYLSCCLSVATVSWIVESDVKMERIDKTMEKLGSGIKERKIYSQRIFTFLDFTFSCIIFNVRIIILFQKDITI